MKSKIIGLTGPTGSGKSTAAKILKNLGCAVIDADEIARNALTKGTTCVNQLAIAFGKDILDKDGNVIRSALAKKAFSNKQNTQLLNSITHPWVFLQTLKLAKDYQNIGYKYIVFDAPVLFESNADIMCSTIISVIAAKETRINRITIRDNITREQALQRMSVQQTDEFYINNSDYIINGEKDITQLEQQLKEILNKLAEER